MSVASMAKLAEDKAAQPPNTLNLISAYIPSEAIAVYIGALGILAPTAQATPEQVARIRFVCFLAGVAVAVLIAIVNVDSAKVDSSMGELWRRRVVVAALAGVAFAIYSAATPSFFFQDAFLTIAFTQWAAAAALVSTVVLPPLAKLLGVREVRT